MAAPRTGNCLLRTIRARVDGSGMDNQDPPADETEALGSERHERASSDREADLDAREENLRVREALSAERADETDVILHDAHARDADADARDILAEERDHAASLNSFLNDEDGSVGLQARRSAGLDRADSKDDRTSAADDRAKLSRTAPPETETTQRPE